YLNDEAPWALIESDRARAATVLYVALRVVDSLKTLFTPFVPFSSQRLHELLGYEGFLAGPLEFREVDEDGETHVVLSGDYESWVGSGEPSQLATGRRLRQPPPGPSPREPLPLFKKLDADQVVEDELARLEQAAEAASA